MKIFRHSIYASAMKQGDLAMWVEEKATPVMEVLAQLYLFPNTEYENHWRGELYARWNQVKLLKNGKLANSKFLYDNTLGINKQYAKGVLQHMIDKEYTLEPISGYNVEEYLEICDIYFKWICDHFSTYRYVDKESIYQKLDEMGL